MAKRGKQANLSFFAFTATPKHKTLAVFGRDGRPAHRYTMRQAIEEEFILDVLKHYTTYGTYYRLLKACEDDPNVDRKKAALALARFMRLHPHNIAQKTEVMVEHFEAVTRHKIGGRAKAMVVTGSRLEAVRYKQSFDRYIQAKGYAIKTLVAFSGTVEDDELAGVTYTEPGMNHGISEKELPEKFAMQEYQVLLVAEKYQTGFDQPLLHTMFVDKRLAGIQAVQTLSRLNRIHPLKEDTFVLDFVNDREEIREAFKTYYEGAEMGEEVDPARMYEIKGELDASGIYLDEEVERFSAVYFTPKRRQSASDHQTINAALDPAVSRFTVRGEDDEEEAEDWRGKVQAFLNLYGFPEPSDSVPGLRSRTVVCVPPPSRDEVAASQEWPGVPVRRRGAARVLPPAEDQRGIHRAAGRRGPPPRRPHGGRQRTGAATARAALATHRHRERALRHRLQPGRSALLRPDRRSGHGRRRPATGSRGQPGREVRAGVQEPVGEPVRRAHGPERGHFRPVHERRALPEDRDDLDGV